MAGNKANTEHKIFDLAAERWSPRAFTDQPITKEAEASLFEAARWAPSAYNEQPWYIIAARRDDPAQFEKLLSCLVKPNQAWAKEAQLLLVFVAKENFAFNGKPNRWALHDCGLALENLLLEAAALGMQAHPMAGFSPDAVRENYGVPEGYDPITAVAVGFEGSPDTLPPELAEREKAPRERREIKDFVFQGKWGGAVK